MHFSFTHLIPNHFAPTSKVWLYQSHRSFTAQEVLQAENILYPFVNQWQTHGQLVKGFATVLFKQFIVLMADESTATVSGCSTDSTVRQIKLIEQQLGIELLNRQSLAFIIEESIQTIPLFQLQEALLNKIITPDTLYFNNLVQTKQELLAHWLQPLKESWLSKKVMMMSER
jgi:hypothetical protein